MLWLSDDARFEDFLFMKHFCPETFIPETLQDFSNQFMNILSMKHGDATRVIITSPTYT